MIKLCYKEYSFKLSQKACKNFFESTGLDLHTVFMKYISACAKTSEMSIMERLVCFSELYTRDIASKALYFIIKEENKDIPLSEIEDATFRVSWTSNDKDNNISEPWPIVMLETALEINDYFSQGLDAKKSDTSERTPQS